MIFVMVALVVAEAATVCDPFYFSALTLDGRQKYCDRTKQFTRIVLHYCA